MQKKTTKFMVFLIIMIAAATYFIYAAKVQRNTVGRANVVHESTDLSKSSFTDRAQEEPEKNDAAEINKLVLCSKM